MAILHLLLFLFYSETTSFITFLQGFRIFKNIRHLKLEVGATRRLNGTSKSEQTDTQTHKHTDRHTYGQIGV